MRRLAFLLWSAATALISSPAIAWKLDEGSGACEISEYYPADDTKLMLFSNAEGGLLLALSNPKWTLQNRRFYDVEIMLGRRLWTGKALGDREGRPELAIAVDADFRSAFASARSLGVFMGDDLLIAALSLKGSGEAVKKLDACVARARKMAAVGRAEDKQKAGVVADPFKMIDPTETPPQALDPAPISGSIEMTLDDYPSVALRDGLEGRVSTNLEIGSDGRVTSCSVAVSSGHPVLDMATCNILQRRGRFEPARDLMGQPTTGRLQYDAEWKLP